MKYIYSICFLSLILFSCTKSSDTTKILSPVSLSVITDTSIKYFVQNTDIPILLDSMTLNLYSITDVNSNNYYVEKVSIANGTPLEQFVKTKITYNPQNVIYNNSNLNIIYNWSTRFQSINFTTNSYTTTLNIAPTIYQNSLVVTSGLFLSLDVSGNIGNPVLVPSQKLDKLLITSKGLLSSIRLFAIKKNGIFTSPPAVKNFDGRMISFNESPNYYYLYFRPLTNTSASLNNLLFYNNIDFLTQVRSFGSNFIESGTERVYIIEYIKDNSGKNIINLNNIIRTNNLF